MRKESGEKIRGKEFNSHSKIDSHPLAKPPYIGASSLFTCTRGCYDKAANRISYFPPILQLKIKNANEKLQRSPWGRDTMEDAEDKAKQGERKKGKGLFVEGTETLVVLLIHVSIGVTARHNAVAAEEKEKRK